MPRGHNLSTAVAIEELFAARLEGSPTRARRARADISSEHGFGNCGITVAQADSWIQRIVGRLALGPNSSARLSPFTHADVRTQLASGETRWFEVKAQTNKSFDQVTEADWIRDRSDFLAELARVDRRYSRHLTPRLRRWLADGYTSATGWSLDDLLLADIAGLPTAAKRSGVGVHTPHHLGQYINAKSLLQVTRTGARLCRLDQIAPVALLLGGGTWSYALRTNRRGRGLWITSSNATRPLFSYNLYPADLIGRHKLHARSLVGVTWVYG